MTGARGAAAGGGAPTVASTSSHSVTIVAGSSPTPKRGRSSRVVGFGFSSIIGARVLCAYPSHSISSRATQTGCPTSVVMSHVPSLARQLFGRSSAVSRRPKPPTAVLARVNTRQRSGHAVDYVVDEARVWRVPVQAGEVGDHLALVSPGVTFSQRASSAMPATAKTDRAVWTSARIQAVETKPAGAEAGGRQLLLGH